MRRHWTEADKIELRRLWDGGMRRTGLMRHLGLTNGQAAGMITRLGLHATAAPEKVVGLPSDHPAMVEGRSLFPDRLSAPPKFSRRRQLNEGGHVLMSGANQRKLGAVVTKGAWTGMPIFSLTLEERATCPASCHNLAVCFGNSMQWATRFQHGPALERVLDLELADLQQRFPRGFVVRLHLLGDFMSVGYVRRWAGWLDRFPALRVFGYTARLPTTAIGAAMARLSAERWDRFAVRLSSPEPGPGRAVTLWSTNPVPGVLICPAQLGKTKSCGSCALCWSPAARDRTIGFIAHGR